MSPVSWQFGESGRTCHPLYRIFDDFDRRSVPSTPNQSLPRDRFNTRRMEARDKQQIPH